MELADWRESGLLHPSLLRLAKIATVDEDLVEKSIGELSKPDRKLALAVFRRVVADWMR